MKPVKKLEPGATIGLIAPSGPAASSDQIDTAIRMVEDMGFNVIVGPGCRQKLGYMAGPDEVRIKDIHNFFADPCIDGIFCMKGGDGAPRLLDRLDYGLIAKHPKVFTGYSDITALHIAFNQRCGFMTFHAPMPVSDFIDGRFSETEKDRFLAAVMSPCVPGELTLSGVEGPRALSGGKAKGRLAGGNLALICALMGTPFEIDTRDKILVIEDVDEANYRIDRMLTQLRLAGKLDHAAGIAIGQFTNTEPASPGKRFPVLSVFKGILPQDKPVIMNCCFGHAAGKKATLPLGAMAQIDGDRACLAVTEAGVV